MNTIRNVHLLTVVVILISIIAAVHAQQMQSRNPAIGGRIQCLDGSLVESLAKCPLPKSSVQKVKARKTTAAPAAMAAKPLVQQLLARAPKRYWFKSDDFPPAITVIGAKRATAADKHKLIWDTNTKQAYFFAGNMLESWVNAKIRNVTTPHLPMGEQRYIPAFYQLTLTGDKQRDEPGLASYKRPPQEVLRKLSKAVSVKSPTDWLAAYQNAVPIKIDTSTRTLKLKRPILSNLSIYFNHSDGSGKILVMRFDPYYKLPLVVEEYRSMERGEGKGMLSMRKYYIDTFMFRGGRRVPISPSVVLLPKNNVIITESLWRQYQDDIGKG